MPDPGDPNFYCYYQNPRPEMLRFVPQGVKSILDVGCGEGFFGASLKQQGVREVWGIEATPKVAENARTRLDRVLVGRVEDHLPTIPEKYFDCVIFNDVLEHLVDPWTVLSSAQRILAADGIVIASIPNIRHFPTLKDLIVGKEWRYQQWGVLDRTHLRFFTENSIRRLFADCGYVLASMTGIEAGPLTWKFRLLNRVAFKAFDDCRYIQFACVAGKRTTDHPGELSR